MFCRLFLYWGARRFLGPPVLLLESRIKFFWPSPCLIHDSPNAEEALGLLSIPLPPTKSSIEQACRTFLDFGVGPGGTGWVIIRSGSMGAYVACRSQPGVWIDAYWRTEERVVDVTGKFPMGILVHGLSAYLLAVLTCNSKKEPETVSWVALPPASHWQTEMFSRVRDV
jgi:hypothetical protein